MVHDPWHVWGTTHGLIHHHQLTYGYPNWGEGSHIYVSGGAIANGCPPHMNGVMNHHASSDPTMRRIFFAASDAHTRSHLTHTPLPALDSWVAVIFTSVGH